MTTPTHLLHDIDNCYRMEVTGGGEMELKARKDKLRAWRSEYAPSIYFIN